MRPELHGTRVDYRFGAVGDIDVGVDIRPHLWIDGEHAVDATTQKQRDDVAGRPRRTKDRAH